MIWILKQRFELRYNKQYPEQQVPSPSDFLRLLGAHTQGEEYQLKQFDNLIIYMILMSLLAVHLYKTHLRCLSFYKLGNKNEDLFTVRT